MNEKLNVKIKKNYIYISAFLNLLISIIMLFILNGSAFHGFVDDGRYIVGSGGAYGEVSPFVFCISYWHNLIAYLNIAIAFILIFKHEKNRRIKIW